MKRTNLILIALAFVFTGSLRAQEKLNVIKLNFLSPIVKTGNIAYERIINDGTGLQLRGFYTGYSNEGQSVNGFALIPEARFYFAKEAPEGFYVAPFVRYGSSKWESEVNDGINIYTTKATSTGYGGGVIVGTQKLYGDWFIFEAFIGIQYLSSKFSDIENGTEEDFDTGRWDGFLPRAGLTIGIAF